MIKMLFAILCIAYIMQNLTSVFLGTLVDKEETINNNERKDK